MKNYKKLEYEEDKFAFEFNSGQYEGIIYFYKGSIAFKPLNEEEVKMKFDYEVVAGGDRIKDEKHFIQAIGDILVEEINESIENNETVFIGGTD